MADWILVPCLAQLRTEFNEIAPGRPKVSDGSIGDRSHQQEVSDHNADEEGRVPIKDADKTNEVHAIDVTRDLGPNASDLTMEKVVQFLLGRCRSGAERRLRYIIFNRRIWSASSGWAQKAYTGASPHTEHAHFSASYDTAREADTRPWHLEEIPVALTDTDWNRMEKLIDRLEKLIDQAATKAAERVWATKLDVNITAGKPASMQPAGSILRYLSPEGKQGRDLTAAVGEDVDAARTELAQLAADLRAVLVKQPAAGK